MSTEDTKIDTEKELKSMATPKSGGKVIQIGLQHKTATQRKNERRTANKAKRDMEGRLRFFQKSERYIQQLTNMFGTLYETDKMQIVMGQDENGKDIIEEKKILQFQYIRQDLQAIQEHLADLRDNGPKPAMREIPLEESELPITDLDLPGATLPEANSPANQEPSEANEQN